jgi:branched-chain amino acid transport system permease protein
MTPVNSTLHHRLSPAWTIPLLVVFIAFPWVASHLGQEFYIGFASRLLIYALVATSLNLIVGFGGMISLGHAAYFGTGAYTVAILMYYNVTAAWISWPAATLAGAVLALGIGAMCLRTKGVYFIMITLAFAQMIYYIFVSLSTYGGDDGLSLPQRSSMGLNLASDSTFYYVVLALCVVAFILMHHLVNSRFGRVIQAIKENETRMQAIGYPVYRYKLVCFTLAGALAALGGALFANQNMMANPSMLHWMESGTLLVMVILGGMGYFFGGVVGAFFMLVLQEILTDFTTHWALPMGVVLLLIILFLPDGLGSLFRSRKRVGDTP